MVERQEHSDVKKEFGKGKELFESRNYQKAIKVFNKCVKMYEAVEDYYGVAIAKQWIAKSYQASDKWERAMEEYGASVFIGLQLDKGLALIALSNLIKAMKELSKKGNIDIMGDVGIILTDGVSELYTENRIPDKELEGVSEMVRQLGVLFSTISSSIENLDEEDQKNEWLISAIEKAKELDKITESKFKLERWVRELFSNYKNFDI